MMGVAISTYNRAPSLIKLLDTILLERGDIPLVVCNDGSADDTIEQCRQRGVHVLGRVNRGIAWNKNRGLYWLFEKTAATSFLLLEDDMLITKTCWYSEWQTAIEQWGHVTWADGRLLAERPGRHLSGTGASSDPYVLNLLTGQAMGFSREAIRRGGYFNPRFRGYGFEHIDLTRRLNGLGYGMKKVANKMTGAEQEGWINISGGMTLLDLPSPSDKSSTEYNRAIYSSIRENRFATKDSITMPWSDEAEHLAFLDEISQIDDELPSARTSQLALAEERR